MHHKLYINPLTPKISLVILLTVCQTVLVMLVGESGIRSTYNPLIDIFIYSHHLSAWYCMDVIKEKFCLGHSWELKG